MEHSESIAKLAPALVSAVAEVENASKNATNPHFKSKYADLAEIINTVKPVFASHGLAVVQIPGLRDGHATVETMLVHSSGEWIKGESGSPLQKNDPQGVGSAITYLRRYSLAALAGIAQEDDDGNAASTPRTTTSQSAPAAELVCPDCHGPAWDNRENKRSPKSPDIKCKDKTCDGAYWLGSWRDDLIRTLADAHERGGIDAAERKKGDDAAASLDPTRMLSLQDWLAERAEAVAA